MKATSCFFSVLTLVLAVGLVRAEDERPVIDASKLHEEKPSNPNLPTFFVVGDSTVRNGKAPGFGWGERLTPYFDLSKINVVNRAIAGRSARTYYNEGRWAKVLAELKAGDFVIIQFGHNDGGRIGDPAMKGRADGKGIGPETVEETKPDGTKELVHTFGWYMAQFVSDAKAKGATAILCSPIPHKQNWETHRDFENVAKWDEEVAKTNGGLFFDLTMIVSDGYRKIGKEKADTFFVDERTHTGDEGARFNAAAVIVGLKALPGSPLARFFSPRANALTAPGL